MDFCSRHLDEMGKCVKRHGFWRYVDSDPEHVRGFAARWLLGKATKDEIDPLVVLMMEIKSKAARMGQRPDSPACPLCVIAFIRKDAGEPSRQIEQYMEKVISPLMITNGRKPGGRGRAALVVVGGRG